MIIVQKIRDGLNYLLSPQVLVLIFEMTPVGKNKKSSSFQNCFQNSGWKDMLLSSEFLYDLGLLARLRQKMMELDPQLLNKITMK
ncbi:hypothetical protein E5L68_016575 [Pedobacter helvus]|uniref:Uncharacterized protein n=1 Tax=Pedobacter helvus TaxID=2563444 RepID=A0ABW9JKN8_9SPHI|nr:hypothetical protein [Pedobacter ureilyticus]